MRIITRAINVGEVKAKLAPQVGDYVYISGGTRKLAGWYKIIRRDETHGGGAAKIRARAEAIRKAKLLAETEGRK